MARAKYPPASTLPEPHHRDTRICFSIAYFTSEADAERYGQHVRNKGYTYNGGFYHGMPCGREDSRDYTDPATGTRYYAVTD